MGGPYGIQENHAALAAPIVQKRKPKVKRESFALAPSDILIAGGVAIFHLATDRVVICYDTKNKFYFLPKGRRDVDEESRVGAEREGWEEVSSLPSCLVLSYRGFEPKEILL